MMRDDTFVVMLPLSVLAIFSVSLTVYHYNDSNNMFLVEGGASFLEDFHNYGEPTCGCKVKNQTESFFSNHQRKDFCFNRLSAVMGGVDMVQFFTSSKLPDGTYNERSVGQRGLSKHSATYKNYDFKFISDANKRFVGCSTQLHHGQQKTVCDTQLTMAHYI